MRNLDKARLRVKNGDNTNTGQLLKLSMFDIYNKLDKLMENDIITRAKVYDKYYSYTNKLPCYGNLNYLQLIDIQEFRTVSDNYTLEELEYAFMKRIDKLYISNVDVLNNQPEEVIKSVIDFTKTDGLDLDMKIAYKYLESIRKEVKVYFKIAGYLKELRIKQWKDNLNILI